jgi:hypothetical protein
MSTVRFERVIGAGCTHSRFQGPGQRGFCHPSYVFCSDHLTIVSAMGRKSVLVGRLPAETRPALGRTGGEIIRANIMEITQETQLSTESRRFGRFRIGRGRLLVLAATAACIVMLSVWMWKVRSLDGLPDVGDPFDVALARRPVDVSDSDNAYVAYAEARRLLTRQPDAIRKVDWVKLTWSMAGKNVRDYLEENRPALAAWRDGTERPEALYNQPGRLAFDTLLPVVQDLRMLGRLAELEGTRLEENGAMGEAWNWYKGTLRSSRHVGRHGVTIERLVGAALLESSSHRINHWAADPRVDAALLRRALADVLAADGLTFPLSENMKLEYLMCLRDLDELRVTTGEIPLPGGQNGLIEQVAKSTGTKTSLQRIRLRATNDVERSRRVLKLLFANWMPQLDKPAALRAPIAISKPTLIYAPDPGAPAAARAIAPDELDAAIGRTLLAQQFLHPGFWSPQNGTPWSGWAWEGDRPLAREPRRRAVLIVKLAAELYRREQGKPPANAGALLEAYLKELPAGIAGDELIPTGID